MFEQKIDAIPQIQNGNSETHLYRLDKKRKKKKNTSLFAFFYKEFLENLFFLNGYSDL